MELTEAEIRTAVEADSHTYARMRGRISELRRKGHHRIAGAIERDYNERLGRWIERIKKEACKGEKR